MYLELLDAVKSRERYEGRGRIVARVLSLSPAAPDDLAAADRLRRARTDAETWNDFRRFETLDVAAECQGGYSWSLLTESQVVLALRIRAFASELAAYEDARRTLAQTAALRLELLKDPDSSAQGVVVTLDDRMLLTGGWLWRRDRVTPVHALGRLLRRPQRRLGIIGLDPPPR